MATTDKSSSSWSSDWATGSIFLDLTSITESVPSPLNERELPNTGMEYGAAAEGLPPRGDKLLFVIQPHEVGDEVEMMRVLANGVLFSRIP